MRSEGFSLVEMLLVLAIIGILAAIGIPSYLGAVRQAQVREAATELASDLRWARTQAQRNNLNVRIELRGGGRYDLQITGQAVQQRTLPHGLIVTAVQGGGRTDYLAPFGEIEGARSWRVETPADTRQARALLVNTVGLTGRVNILEAP